MSRQPYCAVGHINKSGVAPHHHDAHTGIGLCHHRDGQRGRRSDTRTCNLQRSPLSRSAGIRVAGSRQQTARSSTCRILGCQSEGHWGGGGCTWRIHVQKCAYLCGVSTMLRTRLQESGLRGCMHDISKNMCSANPPSLPLIHITRKPLPSQSDVVRRVQTRIVPADKTPLPCTPRASDTASPLPPAIGHACPSRRHLPPHL